MPSDSREGNLYFQHDNGKNGMKDSPTSPESSTKKTEMRFFKFMESGSSFGVFINYCKSNIGSGVLSYPFAMMNAGSLIDTLFLVLITTFSVITVRYNIFVVELTGMRSYEELSHALVAKWFKYLTIFLLMVGGVGSCISYIVVLSNIFSHLENISWFPGIFRGSWGNRCLTTIFWALLILPMTLLKHIDSLRFSSLFGICAVIYLMISVVVMASVSDKSDWSTDRIPLAEFSVKMVLTLPLCIFGFSVQTACFPLYRELKNPSVNKMTWIVLAACIFTTMVYIIFGLAGAARYGKNVNGNILINFRPTHVVYQGVACLLFCFSITFTFPVIIYVTRVAILQLFNYRNSDEAPFHIWFTIAGVLSIICCILGLFAPSISTIFGLLGGITGSTLFFIWPCIFLLRTGEYTREKVGTIKNGICWFILFMGVAAGIFGTSSAMYTTFS